MPAIHILIKGKVQGVFYRSSARQIADKLGLKGWIRNTKEGDVEAIAVGSETQLNDWISWCRHGPPDALVTNVIVSPAEVESFNEFIIKKTGDRS